jgi:hypothetical protein
LLAYRTLVEPGHLRVVTSWRATGPQPEPLRTFVHALDAEGNIAGQHDGLGSSAHHWRAGDLVLQLHPVDLPPGEYTLRLGLYHPATGIRLLTATEHPADVLLLGPVAVP